MWRPNQMSYQEQWAQPPGYLGAWSCFLGCFVPILLISFMAMFLPLERGSRGGSPMIGCRPAASPASEDARDRCSLLFLGMPSRTHISK